MPRHGSRQVVNHRDDALRLESDGVSLQVMKRASQQPGADEEDETERELKDNERAVPAETRTPGAPVRPRRAALPPDSFERLPRGKQTAEDAGHQSDDAAEDEHARVDAYRVQARQMRRRQIDERPHSRDRQRHPEAGPGKGKVPMTRS